MQRFDVVLSRFAENDLKEIIAYFSDINPEYTRELYNKIKTKILELKTFPNRGKIVPELEKQGIIKYRQILEGNYRIIYSIKNSNVNILIIIDSRRNLEEILLIKLTEISESEET